MSATEPSGPMRLTVPACSSTSRIEASDSATGPSGNFSPEAMTRIPEFSRQTIQASRPRMPAADCRRVPSFSQREASTSVANMEGGPAYAAGALLHYEDTLAPALLGEVLVSLLTLLEAPAVGEHGIYRDAALRYVARELRLTDLGECPGADNRELARRDRAHIVDAEGCASRDQKHGSPGCDRGKGSGARLRRGGCFHRHAHALAL